MGKRKGERGEGGRGERGQGEGRRGEGIGDGRWGDSLRHQQDGAHSPSRAIFS